MEGTRFDGVEVQCGSEPSTPSDARYRVLIAAAALVEGREEGVSGSVLSSWTSGSSRCRCARLCWLYNCLHRHHQTAAKAANTTATLARAITMMPQMGTPFPVVVRLFALLSLVDKAVVLVIVIALILVGEVFKTQ